MRHLVAEGDASATTSGGGGGGGGGGKGKAISDDAPVKSDDGGPSTTAPPPPPSPPEEQISRQGVAGDVDHRRRGGGSGGGGGKSATERGSVQRRVCWEPAEGGYVLVGGWSAYGPKMAGCGWSFEGSRGCIHHRRRGRRARRRITSTWERRLGGVALG